MTPDTPHASTEDTSEALDAFWSALESSPFLMLGLPAQVAHSMPMTAQFDGRHGPIWFYGSRSSRLAEGLSYAARLNAFARSTDDCKAGVAAFLGKTDPPWRRDAP